MSREAVCQGKLCVKQYCRAGVELFCLELKPETDPSLKFEQNAVIVKTFSTKIVDNLKFPFITDDAFAISH